LAAIGALEAKKMPDTNGNQIGGIDELRSLPKVLIVDDDNTTRETLGLILENSGFRVAKAASVNEALKLIGSQAFDVLLSDLHMPHPSDGLTVASAMRNAHPKAVTLILSSYPAMREAAETILLQADEVLVKPMAVVKLIDLIRERLKQRKTRTRTIESVATILEQETQAMIEDWLLHVEQEPHLIAVPMDFATRSAHLPQLLRELVERLRHPRRLGEPAVASPAAVQHGMNRCRQGYSAAMLVEESRMLQVSIFQTLQTNLHRVNFSLVLQSVMTIADEIECQLAEAMAGYVAEPKMQALPIEAYSAESISPPIR
jgi:YesN/AraC family two-component response regulator